MKEQKSTCIQCSERERSRSPCCDRKININIVSDIEVIEDILEFYIYSDTLNMSFPLSDFINIETSEGFAVINKIDNIATSYIQLYVSDDSTLKKLRSNVNDISKGYSNTNLEIEYGGENEMFEEIKIGRAHV